MVKISKQIQPRKILFFLIFLYKVDALKYDTHKKNLDVIISKANLIIFKSWHQSFLKIPTLIYDVATFRMGNELFYGTEIKGLLIIILLM